MGGTGRPHGPGLFAPVDWRGAMHSFTANRPGKATLTGH
jgi:hypothetical protein